MNAYFLNFFFLIVLGKNILCSVTDWSIVPSRSLNVTARSIIDHNRITSEAPEIFQNYPQYNSKFKWLFNPVTNRYEAKFEKNVDENDASDQENSVYEKSAGLKPHEMNTKEILPNIVYATTPPPPLKDAKPATEIVVSPHILKGLETVRASVMSIVDKIRNIWDYVWYLFSPGNSFLTYFCFSFFLTNFRYIFPYR